MFGSIRKLFIGLLPGLVTESNHISCVSIRNQKCMIQPTLINLYPNQYSQEFNYRPFAVNLYRCVGSSSTLIDLPDKVCVSNKTEELNLRVFSVITEINESKTLTKIISCKCKCSCDGRKCNSEQYWNNNKCWCES